MRRITWQLDGAGRDFPLSGVGGRRAERRGMNGEGLPWRVAIQKPTDKKTRFRLWWISTVMGLAPLALP